MGTDTNTHIGPYMVVNGNNETKQELMARTCSNKECKINIENKEVESNFCSECGSPIEGKIYKATKNIRPAKLLYEEEEFEDLLSCVNDDYGQKTGFQTFVSNKRSPFDSKERRFGEWQYGEIDLRNINQTEEIDWFKNEYDNIITLFELVFGKGSVEIKWGVIQWFS